MTGSIIDNFRYTWKSLPELEEGFFYLDTDYGKIRVFDTKGNLPIVINVPDGPNVIEHQLTLIQSLSKNFRVICFEYPGLGFSFPNSRYDYSFENGANLLHQVMDILKIERTSLLFSCSNGYYGIQAAIKNSERFNHMFLSQTPATHGLLKWTEKSIPTLIKTPFIGQLTNAIYAKKFPKIWYKYALPKESDFQFNFTQIAQNAIHRGGCFCLSSLVQGLKKDIHTSLNLHDVPATLVWGGADFTHRNTHKESIKTHIEACEIIEFKDCGHFPELERTADYVQLIKERIER